MNNKPRFYSENVTELAENLRRLADAIEYGRLPAPYGVYVGVHYVDERTADGSTDRRLVTAADARRAMSLSPGSWNKEYVNDKVSYTKVFGNNYPSRVTMNVYVDREEVCTRVQTGTRHVEAREAYDEPVYEWQCTEPVFADEDPIETDPENGCES